MEFLKNSTTVPNWLMGIFVATVITMFTTGWVKMDNIRVELSQEQVHRKYISEQIHKLDVKMDKVLEILDTKEDK